MFLRHLTLIILRRPMLLHFCLKAEILRHLYVPDEGSLLPKYRDCTTYNDFELYLTCCGVMLLLLIIYTYILPYIWYHCLSLRKKVYDRNIVNKYRIYLLLGAIILNLIDYIYIHI